MQFNKGRAIWATGNNFTEIQAPFISEDDLKKAIFLLREKYKQKKSFNFKPMIEMTRMKKGESDTFSDHTKGPSE